MWLRLDTETPVSQPRSRRPRRGRVRTGIAAVLTILALLLVWGALVAPAHPSGLTPGTFVRLPLEGIVVVALALALPATARRVLAWVVGPALGLLVIVKILDIGFFATFDRPFDPVADWSYAGIGIETLRDSVGRTDANLAVAGVAVLVVAVLVLTTLAVLRLTRVAAGHRRWSLRAVMALGARLGALLGVRRAARLRTRPSPPRAPPAWPSTRYVRCAPASRIARSSPTRSPHDRFRNTPGDQLLTGLRGKDVIFVFVESYGGSRSRAPLSRHGSMLRSTRGQSDCRPPASPPGAPSSPRRRSAAPAGWRTPPLHSGVWVNSQRRYDQLVATDRFTLSQAFERAGWRTVGGVPANNRDWPQGSSFYRYDKVYDQRNLGYLGPRFACASMPDQYVLAALQRLELAKPDRPPVFAEVDLVSSHAPWTRIPELIDWGDVGNGSIFNSIPVDQVTEAALWSDPERVRAAYGRSIEYSLNTLVSFVQHYGDDDLVLVVLGDHQP